MRIRRLLVYLMLLVLCLFIPVCARYRGPIVDERGATLKVKAPTAKHLSIAGTFNDWDRERGRLAGTDREGWWSITLPLRRGEARVSLSRRRKRVAP